MDILEIIRIELDRIPDGDHSNGLRSVLGHIEVANRHLLRGQTTQDDSAFTDAIYRTNQAFEGSLKEAYRVLAEKTPDRMNPYEIEKYLEQNEIFKPRVLDQLRNYRSEWRNKSVHDHKLDFDEDEAFLAIVSVSALAKLLISEIAQKVTFVAVQKDARNHHPESILSKDSQNLAQRIGEAIAEFLKIYAPGVSTIPIENEAQLLGALSGFLSSVAPDLRIFTEQRLSRDRPLWADLVVENDAEKIVVELKNTKFAKRALEYGLRQLESYLLHSKASGGILLLYSPEATEYEIVRHDGTDLFKIWVFAPSEMRFVEGGN